MTETVWDAPPAEIPVRATVTVPHLAEGGASHVVAPTVADAAVFLAAAAITTGTVVIRNWDAIAEDTSAAALRDALASMGTYVVRSAEGLTCTSRSTSGHLDGISVDLTGHRDLVAPLFVLASLADHPSELRGLRGHGGYIDELVGELRGLGADVAWDGETARIAPQPLHAGVWRGGGEPAAAALGAVLALVIPGVQVAGLALDGADGRRFLEEWRSAMTADEHILPGSIRGTVPFYL